MKQTSSVEFEITVYDLRELLIRYIKGVLETHAFHPEQADFLTNDDVRDIVQKGHITFNTEGNPVHPDLAID